MVITIQMVKREGVEMYRCSHWITKWPHEVVDQIKEIAISKMRQHLYYNRIDPDKVEFKNETT